MYRVMPPNQPACAVFAEFGNVDSLTNGLGTTGWLESQW